MEGMTVRVINVVPVDLRDRFAAAAAYEPLCDLSETDSHELDEVLAGVDALEDLPGRWQAALLCAEAARAGQAPPPSSCCGGGGR